MNVPVPLGLGEFEADTIPLLRLRVQAIRLQADGIHAFELVDPDGAELPPATAGAHVDVHLPDGLVRSYSLSGDPANCTFWTLGVLREVNGLTRPIPGHLWQSPGSGQLRPVMDLQETTD